MKRFALALLCLAVSACSAPDGMGEATPPTTPAAEASDTAKPTESSAPSAAASTDDATPSPVADPLLAVTLTDVRSGEVFTMAELAADGPLLVEPMAVWCTSCRAQQHEVKAAHARAEFASLSLDVDLSESPEDLAAYADREGFSWSFAMADAALYRELQERFGTGATNPPSTPLIVIEPDGTIRALDFGRGVRSADQLLDELGLS